MERKIVAYHEAGHAVAAIVRRVRFERVSIKPNDDSLGRVVLSKWDVDDLDLTKAVNLCITAIAGPESESRFTNESKVLQGSDREMLVDLLTEWESDADCRNLLAEYVDRKTIALIDAYWDGITRVSEKLETERELSFDEVKLTMFGV